MEKTGETFDEQIKVVREIADKRKDALSALSEWDMASEIMEQDETILRALSKS